MSVSFSVCHTAQSLSRCCLPLVSMQDLVRYNEQDFGAYVHTGYTKSNLLPEYKALHYQHIDTRIHLVKRSETINR